MRISEKDYLICKEEREGDKLRYSFFDGEESVGFRDKTPILYISISEKVFETSFLDESIGIQSALRSLDLSVYHLFGNFMNYSEEEFKSDIVVGSNRGIDDFFREEKYYRVDLRERSYKEIKAEEKPIYNSLNSFIKYSSAAIDRLKSAFSLNNILGTGLVGTVAAITSMYSSVLPRLLMESTTLDNPVYSDYYPIVFSAGIVSIALTAIVSAYYEKIASISPIYSNGKINAEKLIITGVGYGTALGFLFPRLFL